MRIAISGIALASSLALAAGCVSDDIAKTSFATVDGRTDIKFARARNGLTNYGGVGFYKFTIDLVGTDACSATPIATLEINTALTGPNAFPTGTIPIRAAQVPETVPSALATFDGALAAGGSITVDSVEGNRVDGSATVTLASGAVSTSFIAYTCN